MKLCLKARPTAAQLADRLRPVDGVMPDGLELYLAAADLATRAVMDGAVERLEQYELGRDFALLIEGPVDSLDGGDFDPTRDSEADTLVVRRLTELGRRIGAKAINIHLIAPSADVSRLTLECRQVLLAGCVDFFRAFADACLDVNIVPTVENMPPLLRMRRDDLMFTPIGMASEDLRWMAERVPGLRVLVDTSHAGLYLNARTDSGSHVEPCYEPLRRYVGQLPKEAADVLGYAKALEPYLTNAQIANAHGLLGEGLGYTDGDIDLDPIVRWLDTHVEHIVTEPIEASNDNAELMRDALRHMRRVLA